MSNTSGESYRFIEVLSSPFVYVFLTTYYIHCRVPFIVPLETYYQSLISFSFHLYLYFNIKHN